MSLQNSIEKRKYNSLDILKLVMSVLIMIIHSGIDKTVISPVLRIAVPLFFIISAYFFFSKNLKLTEGAERLRALLRMIKRNLFLYLFWALLQLPLMMYFRDYFHESFPTGILNTVKDVVLGNGFTGSWFIFALIIGTVIIFFLSKKIPSVILVIATLPIYAVCCLITNYSNLFDTGVISAFADGYLKVTGWHFYTSFPAALFWISLGRFFAEKEFNIKNRTLISLCVIFGFLFALERVIVVKYNLASTDDCYFMLIPFCAVFFQAVKNCSITVSTGFRIREVSTVIYVAHGLCERIVGYILKLFFDEFYGINAVKVTVSLLCLILLGHIIVHLKEKRKLAILKYSV